VKRVASSADEPLDEVVQTVVRRKRFQVLPMTEVEAIEQLDLLGHDFFLYFNADSGAMSVLYRRKDGHLGLIEAERA
jgi:putative sigma-54 modulation protein